MPLLVQVVFFARNLLNLQQYHTYAHKFVDALHVHTYVCIYYLWIKDDITFPHNASRRPQNQHVEYQEQELLLAPSTSFLQ